jgi:hypothetical protein
VGSSVWAVRHSAMVVGRLGLRALAKCSNRGGGTEQDLGVDFGVVVEFRDVAKKPYLVGIQKHDFASVLVGDS